jgi:TonB family protein
VKVGLGPAGSGVLVDVSAGGIRVQSLAPLRRGAEVPLRIEIPDQFQPLCCNGAVVWSKPNGAAGIQFVNLEETQQKLLNTWLADLERGTLAQTRTTEQDEFNSIVAKIKGLKLNNADALNVIVERVIELTSATGAAVALGSPENLVCMASGGGAPEVGTQIPPGAGLTGECVRRRKMVHCQNAQNDPRVGPDLNLGSAVVIPLMVNGDLRGVLEAFSVKPYAFNLRSLDSLEKLADAVVFLNYGIVTQRRLASVTPLSDAKSATGTMRAFNPSPTDTATRPAMTMPTQTQSASAMAPSASASQTFTRPVASPASSSQTFARPVVPIKPEPPKVEPIAAPIKSAPVTAPSPTPAQRPAPHRVIVDPLAMEDVEEPVVVRRPPVRATERHAEKIEVESGKGRLVLVAAILLVVAAVPIYFWQQRQSKANAAQATTATAPETTAATTSQPEAMETPAPTPVAATTTQAQILQTNAVTQSGSVSTPAVSKTMTIQAVEPEKKAAHKEAVSTVEQPEPMMIASGRSVRGHKTDEGDDTAAAPQLSVPAQIEVPLALPGTSSVPKLTAEVAKVRSGGVIIRQISPIYPSNARAMGLQGQVELQIRVNKDGSVDNIKRVSGNPILANAAMDAVRRWRYEPYKIDGQPIEMDTNIKLNFNLPR